MAGRRVRQLPVAGVRRSAPPPLCNHTHGSLAVYRTIYNYAGDAGQGSQNFSVSETWRSSLLGTVAAGALLLGYGRSAKAGPTACVISGGGTIATCQGDQSNGVIDGTDFNALPVTTLNVNTLTANIAPAAGAGINVNTAGSITINSDLGTHSIVATGNGIYASGSTGVTIDHKGAVQTSATGIAGVSNAAVSITQRSRKR